MSSHPEIYYYTGDSLLFAPFQIVGIFAACFTGMFLGTEYSDGTLRNKLIVGLSRLDVYLSNLILSFCASLIVNGIAILVVGVTGSILLGPIAMSQIQILQSLGIGIFMLAAFAGIFTLISMLIPSKSAGSVACILGFFLLLMAAVTIDSRLNAEEFISPGYVITVDGVEQIGDLYPNPMYLEGTARTVFEFFLELLPTGQGNMLTAHDTEHPLRMMLCSLGITVCTTVSGIRRFQRKNLK